MNTYTIEITNNKAHKFLKNLEDLNIIKLVKTNKIKPGGEVFKKNTSSFRGSLKLSNSRFNNLQKHVEKVRNEWPENI